LLLEVADHEAYYVDRQELVGEHKLSRGVQHHDEREGAMKIAGGVIALIAGIISVILAAFLLLFGEVVSWFWVGPAGAETAEEMISYGWGGLILSLVAIVVGAVALVVKSRWPGILLMICSLAGAILGQWFLALAFVGGMLVTIGASRSKKESAQPQVAAES
jgi:hypothetical protein